jgi:ATP-binding cassette subfamily C (CFTR/MRP) protein 9
MHGSIRENIDPFSENDDSVLWQILEKVKLAEFVKNLPGSLDFQLGEGEQSFSLGQRQVLCIARAIVRKSKILLLDEATASVDVASDALIQNVLASELGSVAVISIAHRLETLTSFDTILELEDGRIVKRTSRNENKDALSHSVLHVPVQERGLNA